MDHSVVKRLRGEVGDQLAEQRRLDAATGIPPMSGEDERQFARAIISQALEEYARGEITAGRPPLAPRRGEEPAAGKTPAGRPPLNAQDEEERAEAIPAALFGVGRLQPLLEDQ